MYNYLIVHYNEIGTKGKNRPYFEKVLVSNLRYQLKNTGWSEIKRVYGRILVKLENPNIEKIKQRMKYVFGVMNYSFAYLTDLDMDKIKEKALELAKDIQEKFYIKTTRANKNFKLTSQEISEKVGEYVINNTKLKVSFENSNPIYIEITEKGALLYTEKIRSLGGLPVGVTGKVVVSLSGGIDSPVSTFLMMKRGCSAILIHFYNTTINTKSALDKIKNLTKILSNYQFKTKLFLVPFSEIQQEIIKNVNSRYRMIVYRRFMMKICELIAQQEKAGAIVTGDNLAQVASQTLENLGVIYEGVKMPILSPVIGNDKIETIRLAKDIETYEVSIQPYEDCCSYFIAPHPETKSNITQIKEMETHLAVKQLIEKAVKQAKTWVIKQ